MKVKHFIYASACLMGLAACNNEEIALDNNLMFDGKGELVELKEGFLLSVGKGELGESRALNTLGQFQWMPENPGASEIAEKIGLCWTGVNNLNPAAAPATTTGDMVYTNYEFLHAGWLYTGENAPKYDVCTTPVQLANGEYLVSTGGLPAATETAGVYSTSHATKTLDFAKGVFNTKNSAIYSGEYIVYYPYSDEFFDSPIVASAPKAVEINTSSNRYEAMSKNSFNVGYVSNFAGGQDTETFATNMLSAGAYVAFTNTGASAVSLKQVVLMAAGENDAFITKQELSAQAIKNANNAPANIGTGLYLGTPKATSKTVVANYSVVLNVPAVAPTAPAIGHVVLPVLPTTISDLKILLVDAANKTAIIDCGSVTFESISKGAYSLQKLIDLKNIEFKKEYIATDATSLNSIISTIDALPAIEYPTAVKPISVRTIGEIALDQTNTTIGTAAYFKYIRFYGDKLIVPNDIYLTVGYDVTIENDIDVMHTGCCGSDTGWMHLYNAKLTGTINNYGNIDLGYGGAVPGVYNKTILSGATLNNLKGEVNEKGIDVEYEGLVNVYAQSTLSLTVDASINNEGELKTEGTGVKNNDGTVTIEQGSTATIANSGLIENAGNINPSNGLSNTTANAIFVDKVGSQLTGYGLDNTVGGEYICEVNDQPRYNTAITSAIRPTTLVRFIDCPTGGYDIAPGDVNNSKGNMVSFEVKKDLTGFEFVTKDDLATALVDESLLVSTVKNFYITKGTTTIFNKKFEVEEKLDINTDFLANMNLIVGSELNVNVGTSNISNAVSVNALNSACTLKVAAGATINFNNFGKSYFNNIVNNGSIDIMVASGVAGVAHELWTKTYTTGTTGVWANNSYPMQY